MRIFNFGRSNRVSVCRLVDDYGVFDGWWISGRILGRYISWIVDEQC